MDSEFEPVYDRARMGLTLNANQMQRLDAGFETARDAAFATYARRRFGGQLKTLTAEQLQLGVRHVRMLALGWGIKANADIVTVLDLAIMYGGNFGHADWAADILQNPGLDGARKAELLRARVRRTVPGF